MSKTVLLQTIEFSISIQFSSIWPIDRTLSGITTPDYSGPGSDGNEGVLCIPKSSSITRTSPSDFLVSYPRHSLEVRALHLCSQCILLPQPTGQKDIHWERGCLTPLQRCSWCILQPQPTGPPGHLLVRRGFTLLQRCGWCILQSQPGNWAIRTLVGGVLLLCTGAISVFYSPSLLSMCKLEEN